MRPPFDPRAVRAILFDIDGTLLDSDDVWVQRIARLMTPIQRWLPRMRPAAVARKLVMWVEGPMNLAYGLWDLLHLDELTRPLFTWIGQRLPHRSSPPPVAGMAPALAQLRSHYPLAVVTARSQRRARQLLSDNGLLDSFSVVVSTGTARRGKPHPAPVLLAAARLGVPPGNCLMVGDTAPDILAGKRAGAQTVAVLSGFGEEEELRAAGASLVLESASLLPQRLFTRPDGE